MKNGKPIVIPLVPRAVEALQARAQKKADDDWVFPGGTSAGHIGPPRKQWAKFLKRAKLTDLHLHDLRRTLGSWMTNTGANTVTTMRALGHRSIDAALIYQRLEISPVRDAMDRGLDAFLQVAKASKSNVVHVAQGGREEWQGPQDQGRSLMARSKKRKRSTVGQETRLSASGANVLAHLSRES